MGALAAISAVDGSGAQRPAGKQSQAAPTPPATRQPATTPSRRVFYVRQTVGDDANDGLSPATAWRSLSRLEGALQDGDTAYVGPGLYREMITVADGGTTAARITFVADTSGEHTTDPPGVVMITGADAVDESGFTPGPAPGVYRTPSADERVWGVVEMDGPQHGYTKASDTSEHLRDGLSELDAVAARPASFFYDLDAEVLYIHTSDGEPPASHEIELIRRSYGIVSYQRPYVTVVGFTFRHVGTAGINFGKGSSHGIAVDNVSYGAWQGIRVSHSTDVLVSGNTSFRNGNSGIYFLGSSTRGHAIGNALYENAKGVRWSSGSASGLGIGNVAWANRENGIAIEHSDDIRLSGNRLVDNAIAQLLVRRSRYTSDANCFEGGGPEQLVAELHYGNRYRTLAEYRQAVRQDLGSREGCGRLPERIDVHELHAATLAYAERARAELAGRPARDTPRGADLRP